ncbi:MAG: VCBS repeat-containing protein, partial [Caldilineaceae bacterium]|nr:VCBS repeat-containing protein [Caldilineaceae bacterium]
AEQSFFVDVNNDTRAYFVTGNNYSGANSGISVYLNIGGGQFSPTPIDTLLPNFAAGTDGLQSTIVGCGVVAVANVVNPPDLTTVIGQPSPNFVAGSVSNVPITVTNAVTAGATTGPIITTMILPTGTSAPASFSSGGNSCTTSGQTVTCINPGPLAAGGSTTMQVPVTPDNTTIGTQPVFNGTTATPGETNTNNNGSSAVCTAAWIHGADDNGTSGLGISAWRSLGDGSFSPVEISFGGFDRDGSGTEVFGDNVNASTYYADIDGDGDVDIVHVTEDNSNTIYVWKNKGDNTFETTAVSTTGMQSVTGGEVFAGESASEQGWMGDANKDGKLDYIFSGNNDEIHVYFGNGDGTFVTTRTSTSLSGAGGRHTSGVSASESFLVADVNGDDSVDLIGTFDDSGTGRMQVWLGNGDGTFNPAVHFDVLLQDSGSSNTSGSADNEYSQFADVDGDGDLDYVHAESLDSTMQIWAFLNNGDGTFQTTAVLS